MGVNGSARKYSSIALRWAVLIVLSGAIAKCLEAAGLPAAFLIGPMVAATAMAVAGVGAPFHSFPFTAAQALLGCLIASVITMDVLQRIANDAVLFVAIVLAAVAISALFGWLLMRGGVLPGTAAVWGAMPGAGTAMIFIGAAYGADPRIVAVMVFTRALCVAIIAALLAQVLPGGAGQSTDTLTAPAVLDGRSLLQTLLVAAAGAALGLTVRLPSGAFLGPVVLGTALGFGGIFEFAAPPWLVHAAYACVAWRIGLAFTRDALAVVGAAMPSILLSSLLLIIACGLLAAVPYYVDGVDFLTAFLATSPGAIDSIAIVAVSSGADVPFVMALQALRVVVVLAIAPLAARVLTKGYTEGNGGAA